MQKRLLRDGSINRDVKPTNEQFTIGEPDEDRASNGRVPGFPRFVSSLVIKLHVPFSTLVCGLNALGFNPISSTHIRVLDLDAAIQHPLDAGGTPVSEPRDVGDGNRVANISGTDGSVLGLIQRADHLARR